MRGFTIRRLGPLVVLLATMSAACGINPATFAGVRSTSRYLAESFGGDLSRRRLDVLTAALAAELASARSKAWPGPERRLLGEYDDALSALRDLQRIWAVRDRSSGTRVRADEIPPGLLATYGIATVEDDGQATFSWFEAMSKIGDTALERLRRADRALDPSAGRTARGR
jgi:hypothetical protein